MSISSPSPPARTSDPLNLSEEAKADEQFIVEKILAKRRTRKGKWEYLLKWAGFSNEDNTWEGQNDIHPDLIAEFERQQLDKDAAIYSTIGDDPPVAQKSPAPPVRPRLSSIKKKKNKINTSSLPSSTETLTKTFGVQKGWHVRAVIGAAKQKDSSVVYAVDYVQGSPKLREYIPSEIAHIYIPRELIEFFQKKIVWNSSSSETKN